MFVALMFVASSAAGTSTTIVWKAPYTGSGGPANTVAHTAGCGTASNTTLVFHVSTGALTGSEKVAAHSCKGSGSGAGEKGGAGMRLNNVTGLTGNATFSVTWKLNFQLTLDMSGTSCSDPAQFSNALLTVEAGVVNWSRSSAPHGTSIPYYHFINTSVSSKWTFNKLVSVTGMTKFQGKDTYAILTAFTYTMAVSVNSPQPGDPDSCTASAVLTPLSGTTLATVVHVALIVS